MRPARPIRGIAVPTVAVAALLAGQALAQPLEVTRSGRSWHAQRSGELPASKQIHVRSKGRIDVRGADRDSVRYVLRMRLRLGAGDGPPSAEREWAQSLLRVAGMELERLPDGTTVFALREPSCEDCRFEAHLEMEVPEQTSQALLVTRRGQVNVHGIAGSVGVRTTGGSITLDAVGGAASAKTAGGSVRLGRVGGPVRCETAGGSIHLDAADGGAWLKTAGGSIRAGSVGGDIEAETAGGRIEIGRVAGNVRATTGAGSILIAEGRKDVHAEAGAGDIRVEGVRGALLASNGAGDILASFLAGASLRDSLLETGVGSIIVSLPASIAMTVDAHVRLAKGLAGIVSDFPSVEVRRTRRGLVPASVQAAGQINGGGALLRLRNEIGRIEVRKRP